MMQGDQYRLPIEFKNSDGSALTASDIKDVEIFVGNFRKLFSTGDVKFEDTESVFYVFLSQKETFMLNGDVRVQARILFKNDEVIGVNLGTVNFSTATSKVVLK